ncbi:MAG: GNAT superfamily N-acetyltransferase [Candidatus Promineifilaceae bacterium]|jgi:GNAT superfamily N-acetyltransferase
MSLTIRQPHTNEKESWKTLFLAYQKFYRARVPDEIIEHTWSRIHDPESDVFGLVAELDGKLIGIAHYLFHSSTWAIKQSCYLEDLFVDKSARGTGAAKRLIQGVESAAREKEAFRLYLHTQEFNSSARSLYDTIMPRSSFIVYRKGV